MLMYTVFTALLCEFYRHDLLVLDTITSKILKYVFLKRANCGWYVSNTERYTQWMLLNKRHLVIHYNLHIDLSTSTVFYHRVMLKPIH